MKLYSNDLKKIVCHRTCEDKERISDVSKELNLPVKTIEKWVALYRKTLLPLTGLKTMNSQNERSMRQDTTIWIRKV